MTQHATTRAQQPSATTTPVASGVLQRKCACGTHTVAGGECASCQKEKVSGHLQLAATNSVSGNEVPPIVHEVLRSTGQPLDAHTRSFFEPRFGHDFSHVRVHTDQRAAESARAVNALAYTVGRDVVFGTGQHAPATDTGKRLLAHELAHVAQQDEAGTASLLKMGSEKSHDSLEEDADQSAARVLRSSWSGAKGSFPDRARSVGPRLKSGLSLQRQKCDPAHDRIITGPLKTELPAINCAPRPETLNVIRALPSVPQTILGVTSANTGHQRIQYQELKGSLCKATVTEYEALSFDQLMYTKAGTYDDGTEVVPRGRACPAGRTIPRRLRITEAMANKIREGEIEHCEDHKLAFALSESKSNQAIKDLEGEYCPGGTGAPDCQGEFAKRFKARTGIDFNDQLKVSKCLHEKTKIRDHGWHNIPSNDWFYAPDCSAVTYIPNPGDMTEISLRRHPSASIIKGCGE